MKRAWVTGSANCDHGNVRCVQAAPSPRADALPIDHGTVRRRDEPPRDFVRVGASARRRAAGPMADWLASRTRTRAVHRPFRGRLEFERSPLGQARDNVTAPPGNNCDL